MSRRHIQRLLPLLILSPCLACAHVPQKTELAKRAGVEASTSELRVRAVELGREMIREVEIATDSIDAGTADTGVRRNTLLWRLSAVPAAQEASLREDPAIAMIDLYAYRLQLSDYLASDAGEAAFGTDAAIAQRAMARFGARWDAAAAAIGAHVSDEDRANLEAWAKDHPINRLPHTRTSLVGDLAQTLRNQASGFVAAVGGMQESVDRLESRISFANETALKQAVWLGRLAALDMGESAQAREVTETLGTTRSLLADAPAMVDRERAAMLAEVDRQRRETLAVLAHERAILLAAMTSERLAVLQAATEQRLSIMQEADSLRIRATADAFRLVDHMMLRIAELVGVLLLLMVIGGVLLRPRLFGPAPGRSR